MTSAELAGLAGEKYVLLTTFRRTGAAVGTAVWVVGDESGLRVTTGRDSGKVKRIRHTPRVELVPCDRRGRPVDGHAPTAALATIVDDPAALAELGRLVRAKYGVAALLIGVVSRLRRHVERVEIRLDAPGA